MRRDNVLVPGEPRLGWVYFGGGSGAAKAAAMLRDTGSSIELTLPLDEAAPDGHPYSRWWSDGIMHMDDPDRTKHSYVPPRVLVFQDSLGEVALVGCRATSHEGNFAAGHGRVVSNFAVLGGRHFAYEEINGMRSEAPAMAAWTHLSAMSIEHETDDQNRVQTVTMALSSPPAISLSRHLNAEMRMTWRTDRPAGGFVASEAVQVQTLVKSTKTWEEHLKLHGALLELVSIAGWRPFGFANVEVQLSEDRIKLSPTKHGEPRWLRVVDHRLPKQSKPVGNVKFLFPYREIGPRGVKRWLKLRDDYDRAIGALLSILRSDEPWGIASVVQSGIALEALGYAIDIHKNQGIHLDRRKQLPFNTALQVILDDMEVRPFTDTDEWIRRANEAYMGAKHPDRGEMPDSLDLTNVLRENLYVLRFWIGLQLGVKPASLLDRLSFDPSRLPFRLVE